MTNIAQEMICYRATTDGSFVLISPPWLNYDIGTEILRLYNLVVLIVSLSKIEKKNITSTVNLTQFLNTEILKILYL